MSGRDLVFFLRASAALMSSSNTWEERAPPALPERHTPGIKDGRELLYKRSGFLLTGDPGVLSPEFHFVRDK